MTSRHSGAGDQVRGTERLFAIVEQLTAGSMTLSEVARSTDLPKSTTLRFLRSLEDASWVFRDGNGLYSMGPALAGLASQYVAGNPLVAIATPAMRDLHSRLNETVSLSRRVGMARVCIQELPAAQNLRLVLGLGELGPLHAGASGILLYAHMPEAERRRLAELGFEQYTSRTITDFDRLETEAEKVRAQGWAMTRGQKTEGGLAIAVPIAEPGSASEVAALGVFGPEIRCSTKRDRDVWLHALLETASEINDVTAGDPTRPGSTWGGRAPS
ncbi:MAG TPA: IclR family transcriptional regulator [Acidimicrobiia bacterium]|nr:IclR family transcriptional regulator [Acidimicrobiia bacterium]